jgi:ribosomal-protein-alanine N-acetyltransferase
VEKGVLKIRSASAEDTEKLVECYIEIWKSLSEYLPSSAINSEVEELLKPEAKERLKQQIEDVNTIFLVADEDEEIIGLVQGRTYAGVFHLGFLGVRKKYRGRGIGEGLLNRFIDEARNRGSRKVWLHTSPRLLPAIKLYVKRGFVPEGFLRKHFHGLDFIIYSKFLFEDEV